MIQLLALLVLPKAYKTTDPAGQAEYSVVEQVKPLPTVVPPLSEPLETISVSHPVVDLSNSYDLGNCTFYAKQRRPDLPNFMGNANSWFSSAQAKGLPTGTTPEAGAIGTTGAGGLGHVVYVGAVNGDGTINISEMNYEGFNIVSTRVAAASDFLYIY